MMSCLDSCIHSVNLQIFINLQVILLLGVFAKRRVKHS